MVHGTVLINCCQFCQLWRRENTSPSVSARENEPSIKRKKREGKKQIDNPSVGTPMKNSFDKRNVCYARVTRTTRRISSSLPTLLRGGIEGDRVIGRMMETSRACMKRGNKREQRES